ncbi:hypothetical protein HK105_206484 [Polyrhizophydium stewartii]|uniref:Uncharacterized protein n=1 Tax=Polyrhizophydium stewartii TaxID=2732419 RepID=A0ABR4N3I2_9FUNG
MIASQTSSFRLFTQPQQPQPQQPAQPAKDKRASLTPQQLLAAAQTNPMFTPATRTPVL